MTGVNPEIAQIENKLRENERLVADGKRSLTTKRSNLNTLDQEVKRKQGDEEKIKSRLLQIDNEKKDLERKQIDAKRDVENAERKRDDLKRETDQIEISIKKAEQEILHFKQEMQRLSK